MFSETKEGENMLATTEQSGTMVAPKWKVKIWRLFNSNCSNFKIHTIHTITYKYLDCIHYNYNTHHNTREIEFPEFSAIDDVSKLCF